jgi:hypothetical protein
MSYEAWGEPEEGRFDAAIEAGWLDPTDLSRAVIDVMSERDRQWNEEGFRAEHDDAHVNGELAGAAAAYAVLRSHVPPEVVMGWDFLEQLWPWSPDWWKPKDRRRDLVRAAALLIAEIERLDRAAGGETP